MLYSYDKEAEKNYQLIMQLIDFFGVIYPEILQN